MNTYIATGLVLTLAGIIIFAFIAGNRMQRRAFAVSEEARKRRGGIGNYACDNPSAALSKFLERMNELDLFTQSYDCGEYTHIVTLPWPAHIDADTSQAVTVLTLPNTGEHPAIVAGKKIQALVQELSEAHGVKGIFSAPFMVAGGMLVIAVGFVEKK